MRQLSCGTAMEEGAVGLGALPCPTSRLLSPPTDELIAAGEAPPPQYDGLYISHIRNEGDTIFDAVDEHSSESSAKAPIRGEIYHLKVSHKRNWRKDGRA